MARETPLPEYRRRYHALLTERSRLDAPPAQEVAAPPPPEGAHRSRRLSLSAGNDGRGFVEVGYRPAIHDLSDPLEGFAAGSQIVFLDGRVRVRDGGAVRLQRLDLVDLFSAAPRDDLFSPWSWRGAAGMGTDRFDGGRERQRWAAAAGAGLARTLWPDGVGYVMAEGEGVLCRGYDRGFGALAGLSAGVAGSLAPRWPLELRLRHLAGLAGDGGAVRDTRGEIRLGFRTTPSTSLSAEGIWAGNDEYRWGEGRLQAGWYF
jgi:hypothetical protein